MSIKKKFVELTDTSAEAIRRHIRSPQNPASMMILALMSVGFLLGTIGLIMLIHSLYIVSSYEKKQGIITDISGENDQFKVFVTFKIEKKYYNVASKVTSSYWPDKIGDYKSVYYRINADSIHKEVGGFINLFFFPTVLICIPFLIYGFLIVWHLYWVRIIGFPLE